MVDVYKRQAFNGLLGTLALVLSAWEGMLPPIPVLPPGAKLGPVSYTHLDVYKRQARCSEPSDYEPDCGHA